MTDEALASPRVTSTLSELLRDSAAQVLLLSILDFLWFMILPLTVYSWAGVGAVLPLLVGAALELIRLFARQRVRQRLRALFMLRAARQALWKSVTIAEVRADSAFWGAHIAEYAVSIDAPVVLGAGAAAVVTLLLAGSSIRVLPVLEVGLVLVTATVLGVLSNRLRQVGVNAIVDRRQQTAIWMAAAVRDNGELASSRATANFLAALTQVTNAWCGAENAVERARYTHRVLIAALAASALLAIVHLHGINPLATASSHALFSGSLTGPALLGSALPAAYAFAAHLESSAVAHSELQRLALASSERPPGAGIRLQGPPRVITLDALTARHGQILALEIDRLELPLNRPIAIAGPNGSGKTTLATLIAGVREASEGRCLFDGVPASDLSRDHIAFVPQEPVLIEALSIAENLRLVAADFAPEEGLAQLRALGLDLPLETLVGNLSRGEQRRIATARALLKRPKLLVLDEPDASLDIAGAQRLFQVLDAAARDSAVFVVSHRPLVLQQFETVVVLNQRHRIEAVGHPRELKLASPTFRELLLEFESEPSDATAPTIQLGNRTT